LDDNIDALTNRDVRGIIQLGGTILETSRCKPFRTSEGREKAAANLKARKVQGLIVIGGDGIFQGANLLSREQGVPVVCVPGTIDNDICGTDYTISAMTPPSIPPWRPSTASGTPPSRTSASSSSK
jgi:6-phosphofructokinase 1